MIHLRRRISSWFLLMVAAATTLFAVNVGAVSNENDTVIHVTSWQTESPDHKITSILRSYTPTVSPGDFPVCTDPRGPFRPFCLPEDGANMTVGGTYYITWDADFYPLNATITIELRYPHSAEGDSAFTSDKTDNSYGYTHIQMRQAWLQGKERNPLTLYIIELDAVSDKRASARQGPTVILHSKPVEHRISPPRASFNKLALYIGLPVSLSVVILVVAGLYFGMRDSRRIDLGNIMGPGYGIRKSKIQRLGRSRGELGGSGLERYSDDMDWDISVAQPDRPDGLERSLSFAFKRDSSKLKSWKV